MNVNSCNQFKKMKLMKKTLYVLILSLVLIRGLVFSFSTFANGLGANREIKNETKISSKPLSNLEKRKKMGSFTRWHKI